MKHIVFLLILMIAGGSAAGQSTQDLSWAEKTRFQGTVAIWYGSHLETTGIHDWEPIQKWNGPYHPLLGEYKTGNREIVRKHLEWLRRAGVDVIFYDAVRVEPEQTLFGLPKQKTLRLMMDELSHQEKESRKLKLVVWLERWNSNPTAQEYKFALDYIRKNLASKDYYFHFQGKPLVVRYFNDPAPDFSAIDKQYSRVFTLRKITPTEGTKDWHYLGLAGDKECMTVSPGGDGYLEDAYITEHVNGKQVDASTLRTHGAVVAQNRADGKLFESQILKARQIDPELIFISGWNDWAWSLEIEPSKEYGFQYVDIAARLLGRWDETLPYRKP